ncbi:MAG TPA: macrolide family glycosyltransferase [Ktedonobacteraceae bacterium]|nr:macrolide family glycosyltransferase [Ktedonobacteraceae bacterium]
MSKVLFFNIPAHGHTYPTLPLVTELIRRGEQVTYYSSNAFRQVIEDTGATFRNFVTPYLNDETQIEENMVRVAYMLLQITRTALAALVPQVKEDKPDYIIHDGLCPWGKYIAQILGIPAICSMTTFAIPSFTLKNIGKLLKSPGDIRLLLSSTPISELSHTFIEGRKQLRPFHALANSLHRQYGIAQPQLLDVFANHNRLNIVYTSKQFQPFADMLDDSFKFVGPSIAPRSDRVSFPFDTLGDIPIIYISLGTVFNDKADFYRTCFDAFVNSECKVVLAVGKRANMTALGTIPDNFIVRAFVPQLELLQRAALLVTHGGMNSVSEALCYGVPLLVIPQTADQFLVGRRIQQLGAGKTLHRGSVTASKLQSLAEEILMQPAYARISMRLGKSLGQPDGYIRAADEIQAFKREIFGNVSTKSRLLP